MLAGFDIGYTPEIADRIAPRLPAHHRLFRQVHPPFRVRRQGVRKLGNGGLYVVTHAHGILPFLFILSKMSFPGYFALQHTPATRKQ